MIRNGSQNTKDIECLGHAHAAFDGLAKFLFFACLFQSPFRNFKSDCVGNGKHAVNIPKM